MSRTIKLGCGFGDQFAFFHLRAISVAEEQAFVARFAETADLPEKERLQKETEMCIDALKAWSVKPLTNRKGEQLYASKEGLTPKPDTDVTEFFSSLDADDQYRVASQLVVGYRNQLQPEVVF